MLYVFGGEKASGAEIVIERLMAYNLDNVEPHLFISPGTFADKLLRANKPYQITVVNRLRKLNRSSAGKLSFYVEAIKNYFGISFQTLQYTKKHNIQFIHANTIVPASYLLPAIILSGKRRKWLWSDHDLKYFAKLDHMVSNWCVKLYNRTLAVSKAVAKKYAGHKKATVLYNGLDTNIFMPDENKRNMFRALHKISETQTVFGIAANISPRKGQLELVNVFKEVFSENENAILLLAGSYADDNPSYNEAVISAMKAVSNIRFIGQVNDMPEFYNGCDVIISNSSVDGSEPLGTTIYEAMACEKIVLASNTGGTPEIIDDGVNGYLFEAGNESSLKSVISKALQQGGSALQLQNNARKKVQETFEIKHMAEAYNRILKAAEKE